VAINEPADQSDPAPEWSAAVPATTTPLPDPDAPLEAPLDAPLAATPAPPLTVVPSTGPLRVLSIIVIAAGVILVIAGIVTWIVVRDQLADENIVVSEDAPFLAGDDVNGPFTAYAEAEAINDHALEASGGLTYAELERDDPTRETVMTASFLRASLYTSVVSFGVAFFAFGVGIILILVGWALLHIERVLRAARDARLTPWAAPPDIAVPVA
jgi:hypothetical protein